MIIDVITIFPEFVRAATGYSILQRAQDTGAVQISAHDLRDYADNRHRSTDDTPYGGGPGMVMMCAPLFAAVESLALEEGATIVMLTPQGERLTQAIVRELSALPRLVLLCGHYEGFDERVREHLATREISIGDYVLTGGELPAVVLIDSIVRLLPGVLGNEGSSAGDTFSDMLLEYPQYTRPADFRGWRAPDVLLSGHHAEIAQWRRKEQLSRTRERRPDLWAAFEPLKSDLKLIAQVSERPAASENEAADEEKS